jgi:hypothetical protein
MDARDRRMTTDDDVTRFRDDLPDTGWTLVDVIDTGAPTGICAACGREGVRYQFVLAHRDYPDRIAVGANCASRLTSDPSAAALAVRRKQFVDSPRWGMTTRGNVQRMVRGHRVTVFRWGDGFGAVVDGVFCKRRFDSAADAKSAIFDRVELLPDAWTPAMAIRVREMFPTAFVGTQTEGGRA